MTQFVKVLPKCKRAKERVKQHGPIMILLKQESHQVLVQSRNKTWSNGGRKEQWSGWFTTEQAEIERSPLT